MMHAEQSSEQWAILKESDQDLGYSPNLAKSSHSLKAL